MQSGGQQHEPTEAVTNRSRNPLHLWRGGCQSDPLGVCAHSVFRDYVHFMISSKLVSDGHIVDEMPVLSAQHFNYFALSEQLEKEFPVLAEMFSFAAEVMLSAQYRDERKGKLKV